MLVAQTLSASEPLIHQAICKTTEHRTHGRYTSAYEGTGRQSRYTPIDRKL